MSFFHRLFGQTHESESLHGEMYRLDIVEELLRDVTRAYQALIDLMVTHVPKAARETGQDQKKKLKQIRNLLDAKPSKPLIAEVRQQLEKSLSGFALALDEQLGQQEKETRQVMAIVAVMAESMAGREKQYNVRFRGIGKKLRMLTASNDIAEIRRKLEAEVNQLEKYVDEMARDTESAVSRVQMELRQSVVPPVLAPRVPQEEVVAFPKAKPLAGRRDAQEAIDARKRFDRRFCVARFCIDNLPSVVSQFGLPAATGLMDEIGELIRQRFEQTDVICRWSDSDWIAISDSGLPEVAVRVGDLEPALIGPYTSGTREVTVALRTSVIEPSRGEHGEETVERIDSMIAPLSRI